MMNLKNLSKLNEIRLDKQKKILVVLFCLMLAYVDVSFVLKPQLTFLNKLSSQIGKYKADLAEFEKGILEMRKIKSNPALTKVKPQGMKKIIADSEIGNLLQDISDSANKLDVKILQMKPLKESSTAGDKVPGAEKFIPLTIMLDTVCDYHQLGKFINSLEAGDVYIKVAEIKISAQQADYFKQKANLVIKTYVKK
ncbi:MAG: type 4a pilus biogenesis protein PilO [Candidatus Omnitrophota bacterium]|jgi:hypothetical protein